MNIIEVIPISRGIFKESLTYFSSQTFAPGDLVTVPIRNKNQAAVVLAVRALAEVKSQLKQAEFPLRKIKNLKVKSFYTEAFIQTAIKMSEYYVSSPGQICKIFTPSAILHQTKLGPASPVAKTKIIRQAGKFVVPALENERWSAYRQIIRESFARQESVFLCLPTSFALKRAEQTLARGIENRTFLLSHQLSSKEQQRLWQQVETNESAVLILATPLFLSLARPDIGTFIVDQEQSGAYQTINRPLVDIRRVIETLAELSKADLVLGDTVLRTETVKRLGDDELTPLNRNPYRIIANVETAQIVSSPKNEPGQATKRPLVNILNQSIIEELKKSHLNNERSFIYCVRTGLAPLVVCDDCGEAVHCERCGANLAVHDEQDISRKRQRSFVCHRCGQNQTIADRCSHCGGWRLRLLGFGSEAVIKELAEKLPTASLWQIDRDTCSPAKARDVAKNFYDSFGSILVGTEMALPYLPEQVDAVAILGMDTLLALPDFKINEKIFSLLIELRQRARRSFLIQTRQPDEPIYHFALQGALGDFYEAELRERKKLSFPPFSFLLKISRPIDQKKAGEEMLELAEWLSDYQPQSYHHQTFSGQLWYSLLIKLVPGSWPDRKLLKVLLALPPDFIIAIEPEAIF